MSILDQIVAEHHSGPTVVHENHDPGSINWVRGVSDPGEMIGCGQYQELRRLDGESDEAYFNRLTVLLQKLPAEHRNRIETAMRKAALRRASLDVTGGKMSAAFADELPWHGLGTVVRGTMTSAEARRLARLTWRVTKMPLYYKDPLDDETERLAADAFALVRQDTGAVLGVVGPKYRPIQNDEGFDFLDGVLGKYGAKYESAGAVYGGRRVWMLAHLPKQAFSVNGSDRVEPYVAFINSHDGSSAARCFPTEVRVECANTIRLAVSRGRNAGISMRHTGSIKERMADAQRVLGIAVEATEHFKETAEALARARVPEPEVAFDGILDAVLAVSRDDAAKGAEALVDAMANMADERREAKLKELEGAIKKRRNILEEILEAHEGQKNGVKGMRGTGWGVMNAVTEVANHGEAFRPRKGSDEDKASRRFESILTGDADRLSQAAVEYVTERYAAKA